MAIISMNINSGLCKTTPFIKSSNFKSSISCQATTLKMQSGKANMYQILSLDSNDVISQDEIKKAYRHKALECHPDTCPESSKEESTRRFIKIKLAYETLLDPVSRESYDFEVGLVDANDRSYGRNRMACEGFSRKIWENQLQGLKQSSKHRQDKRRNQNVS